MHLKKSKFPHDSIIIRGSSREARFGWLIPLGMFFYFLWSNTPFPDVALTATVATTIGMLCLMAVDYNLFSFVSIYVIISLIFYPIAAYLNLIMEFPVVRQDLWGETSNAMLGYSIGTLAFIFGVFFANVLANNKHLTILKISKSPIVTKKSYNICLSAIIFIVFLWKLKLGLYYHSSITEYAFSNQNYLNLFAYLTWISYCGIFLQVYRFTITKEKLDGILGMVLALIPVVIFLPSGSRMQALGHLPLLIMFYGYWETRGKIKLAAIITLLIILITVIVSVGLYRNINGVSDLDVTSKYELLMSSTEATDSSIENVVTLFVSRISDYVATGRIITTTPEQHSYRFIEGMENWWQIAIPGFLRPDDNRINFNDGAYVTQTYGVSAGWWTSTPVMTIGDLFSRFGWAGVVIGMFSVGFLLRKIDYKLYDYPIIPRIIFFVIFSRFVWVLYEMSLLHVVVTFTRDLIASIIISFIIIQAIPSAAPRGELQH